MSRIILSKLKVIPNSTVAVNRLILVKKNFLHTSNTQKALRNKQCLLQPIISKNVKIVNYSTDEAAGSTESIKAYLCNNQNDKAFELFKQNVEKSKNFDTDQLYDIIRAAMPYKCEEIIELAINLLPETIRNAKLIDQDLRDICIESIHSNEKNATDCIDIDPYKLIIRHLPVPVFKNENMNEYGTFLLEKMITMNQSVSQILKLCEDLMKSKRNTRPIHFCCAIALEKNLPSSREFLVALSKKEALRSHYLWPLFIQSKNENDIIDVLRLAIDLKTRIDIETLDSYVLPLLSTKIIASYNLVRTLTENGVRMMDLKSALISFFLKHNRPEEALEIASFSMSYVNPFVILPALINYVKSKEYKMNAFTITNLVKKLQHCRSFEHNVDLAGELVHTMSKSDRTIELCEQLLINYKKVELKISRRMADSITTKLLHNRENHEKLNRIINSVVDKTYSKEKINETKIESLRKTLIEFEAKGIRTHGM